MLATDIKIQIHMTKQGYHKLAGLCTVCNAQRHDNSTCTKHTKAGREHVCDSLRGIRQEEGPVETEDDYPK